MKKLTKLLHLLFTIHVSLIGISAQTEQKAELVVQTGHNDSIRVLAYSPDSKLLASAGNDNTVIIWDISTGSELRTFRGHKTAVTALAFSPDGKLLASISHAEGMIRIWDIEAGKELWSARQKSGGTVNNGGNQRFRIAFSPDGKYLVIGRSSDMDESPGLKRNPVEEEKVLQEYAIGIWSISEGKKVTELVGHKQDVPFAIFSSDGKYIVSASEDKTVKLWDFATNKEIKTFSGIMGEIKYLTLSKNSKYIGAVIEESEKLVTLIWDFSTGQELQKIPVEGDGMIEFSSDEKMLMDISSQTIRLWNINTGGKIPPLSVYFGKWMTESENKIYQTKLLKELDDKNLATVISNFKRRIDKNPSKETEERRPELISKEIKSFTEKWKIKYGLEEAKFLELQLLYREGYGSFGGAGSFDYEVGPKLIAVFDTNARLFAVAFERSISIWDWQTKKLMKNIGSNITTRSNALISPDGTKLVTGNFLLTLQTGEIIKSPKYSLAIFSPDSKMLATKELDDLRKQESSYFIRLLDTQNLNEIKKINTGMISNFIFNQNGKLIATSAYENSSDNFSLNIWEVETGKLLKTLPGINQTGLLTFSPNEQLFYFLALGDEPESEYIVKSWNFVTGEVKTILKGNVGKLAFSKDAQQMAFSYSFNYFKEIILRNLVTGEDKILSAVNPADIRELLKEVPDYFLNQGAENNDPNEGVHISLDGKWLILITRDGRIRLIDFQKETTAADLILLSNNEWVITTPGGLFDASPGARKLMHYVVGLEPIALEQMKEMYYVPRLLQKIFKGEPLPKVELFSKKDLFPDVEFTQPKANQNDLTIKLTNRGGGIGQVQVLINGKEFIADARPLGFDANEKETTLTVSLKDAPLIDGQENKIEVVARNAAGSLSTRGSPRGVQIINSSAAKKNIPTPNIYLIASGISNYTGDNLKLNFAAKDAEDFAKAVELGAVKLLGDKSKVHIRLLTSSGANSGVKFDVPDARLSTATKADFQAAFADFKNATPNDVFIVYLAGHGISLNLNQNPNQAGGDTYLYLTQEATTTDKSVLSIENSRKAMTVSSDELKDLMKQNKALKQVLILDTCASGQAATSFVQKRDLPSDQIRAIERLKDNTGFYVLMGSAADAVSYEASQYGQGLLTYSLLQGMKGARLRENQFADIGLLFSFAQEQVPQMAKNIGGIQQPRIITPDTSASFDIGKFTVEEQKLINLSNPKPLILRPTLQNKEQDYDDLELTRALQTALREANYVSTRGEGGANSLIFVDADEMVDAVKPSGSYVVKGDEITVTIRFIRNKIPVQTLTVNGKIGEKEALIKAIVAKITEALQR